MDSSKQKEKINIPYKSIDTTIQYHSVKNDLEKQIINTWNV